LNVWSEDSSENKKLKRIQTEDPQNEETLLLPYMNSKIPKYSDMLNIFDFIEEA
jgi:hypothetical protein